MDQVAINAFTPTLRDHIFEVLGVDGRHVLDLGGFESFVFLRQDKRTVLRITHAGHRRAQDLHGEIDFVAHLARGGAPVCEPLCPDGSAFVLSFDDFLVTEFREAPGRLVTQSQWRPSLFKEWGRSIGQFHRLARDYEPADAGWRRMDWQDDPNFDAEGRLPAGEPAVVRMGRHYRAALANLPQDRASFGLIHGDAHAGNFFVENNQLTFFDFDDCGYCWFGYDVATVLFSAVLQPWMENTREVQEAAARDFLPPFLAGYQQESSLHGLMLDAFPLFLKVRELSLYGVINTFLDLQALDGYPMKFMADRRRRIEQDEPFLDLDLMALAP